MYPRKKSGRTLHEQMLDWLRFRGQLNDAYYPQSPESVFRQDNTDVNPLIANRLIRTDEERVKVVEEERKYKKMLQDLQNFDLRVRQIQNEGADATSALQFNAQERERATQAKNDVMWRQNINDMQRLPQTLLETNNLLYATPGEGIKPFFTLEDYINSLKSGR